MDHRPDVGDPKSPTSKPTDIAPRRPQTQSWGWEDGQHEVHVVGKQVQHRGGKEHCQESQLKAILLDQ